VTVIVASAASRRRPGVATAGAAHRLAGRAGRAGEVHADDDSILELRDLGDARVDHGHADAAAGEAWSARCPAGRPHLVGTNRGRRHRHVRPQPIVTGEGVEPRVSRHGGQCAGGYFENGRSLEPLADGESVPRRQAVYLRA
jgi:hypothetical protein